MTDREVLLKVERTTDKRIKPPFDPVSMAYVSTATRLSLTVVRASNVKWDSAHHRKLPNLYVQIEFNNAKRRTRTVEGSVSPEWDESFSFDLPPTGHERGTKLNIQVKHDSLWRDKCVGEIDVEFSGLLNCCANSREMELRLNRPRNAASVESTVTLHLRLDTVDAAITNSNNIDAAEHATQQSGISTSAAGSNSVLVASVDAAMGYFQCHADLYESVGNLVSKLDVFVRAMDTLSQVHPYVNFAWQVASALYKGIRHQFEVDKKVVELVHAMSDAFDFVDKIGGLCDKATRLEATIIQLLEQTDECCLFIQEYARRNFARRMAMLSTDATIDEYLNSLRILKKSIDSEIVVHIAFVSSRISSKADALFLKSRLNPVEMNAFDRPQCLPGTRAEIQNEIVEWASSSSDQNVFWLHGIAGSGKSTVSMTVAERFRAISRLGAHLFFQRGKSEPSSVIRTLVYKLASFDGSIAKYVVAAIEQDNDIALASGTTQFLKLVNEPLVHAGEAMRGPVVIVLDALDECGTSSTRQSLLELLREGLPVLPKNFRFLITSRKELDIDRALSSRPESVCAVELEHDSTNCKDDVRRYIDHEMRKVFTKNMLRITDDWRLKVDRLGDAAGGLFIWASIAIKLVDRDYPARRLNDLVSQLQSLSGLSNLYRTILDTSGISFDDKISKGHFSQVLSLILLCKVPLSDDAIDGILGYSDEESSRLVLSRLQSVLVYIPGEPVRICHSSFRDYLLDPERESDNWYIDLESQKIFLITRCFDMMRDKLRFNVCGMESSHLFNNQILDLPDRVKVNIPPQLEYACLFWTQHLREVQFSPALLNELSDFLNRRFLYWLEVMSLLGKVDTAGQALLHATSWISSHNAEVLASLRDARRMITVYLPSISRSTPHIYVSVLLFASTESKFLMRLSEHYLPLVQVHQLGVMQRSPLLKKLTGHTAVVTTVAFSLDGTRIVSGSSDMTIRVWDAESGRIISGPFEGHTSSIRSVSFSPDGMSIVSGSSDRTIRIWDVESGRVVFGPLRGHTSWVYSVAFSPDGKLVVSGSADKTILIWNVDEEQTSSGPLKGHTGSVRSVAFSLDSKHIVSGSDDKTIRIWNAKSGQTICGPLEGHADHVMSVAFSRDAGRVVSGSVDRTIRVWDAETGQCISGPLTGHTSVVCSVAFLPDGKRIISGSDDRTVRIWYVENRQVVFIPFEGHSLNFLSIAFSPDGTRAVTGAWDCTIRIWDAESVSTSSKCFEGHGREINSVAFSPNGKYIASGSHDNMIRIWDTEGRRTVSGPFEGHSGTVWSVAFSPDGRRVASGSNDRTIRVWNVEGGEVLSGPFKGHKDAVRTVSFSPDGTHVVSGSEDKTLRIWDVKSGRTPSGPFEGHGGSVRSVAFSTDGRHVVSGSLDKTVILWDVETGKAISGPWRGHTDSVLSVAFSSDGTRVVSGSADATILVWNVASGQVVVGPFKGHTNAVRSVKFSTDRTRVVSGSSDRTVRVWDAETGQAMFPPLEGHTGSVRSVAFSPDGRRIVSGSWDRTIKMWNAEDDPVFDWTLDRDGWVRGCKGELLLWVPPDIRPTLWRPQNTAIFNCAFSTKLDFTNASLGKRWQEGFIDSK